MRVRNVDFGQTVIQGPRMMDGLSTVHHDDEGAFAAKKIYQKLEKRIYGEGLWSRSAELIYVPSKDCFIYLINIAYWVEVKGCGL